MRGKWLCTFLLLMFASSLYGAQGKIEGVVRDGQSGEALIAANVLLEGTSYGAATNLEGKFVISNVPEGDYTLVARYIGYQEKKIQVTVRARETAELQIDMDFQMVQGEVIEVTAQAEGQIAAINQQLASNTISNVVSKSRIQELPDVNAAESIGRLPGVSIQRSGGEANQIAIRGLSPKYNTVTVNGVRVPSTGGSNRSVDLSLISSNMLDGIEVKKAVTPDMDADFLGGAVDLRLREASEGVNFNVSAQTGYNRLQEDYGNYNITATLSNRFVSNNLGVIASFNTDEYDRSADKFSANYRQSTIPQTNERVVVVNQVGLREETVTRGRTGASVVLDYRIPKGKITANSFFNRRKFDGLNRINDFQIGDNRHYYDLELRSGTTSIFTGAVGFTQHFDWLRYDAGVARSASRSDNPEDFVWRFGQEANAFGQAPDHTTHPDEIPGFATPDSLAGLQHILVQSVERDENTSTAHLNIQADFRLGGAIKGYIKTGGKIRRLDRVNDQEQAGRRGILYGSGAGNLNAPLEDISAALPQWDLDNIVGNLGVLPVSLLLDDYTRTNFLNGDFDLGFVYSTDQATELTRALQTSGDSYRPQVVESRGQDYDGVERYKAAYVMAELNLGSKITLTPGIRWEDDFSEYNGQRFREVLSGWEDKDPSDLQELTNVRENAFWLPMAHLQLKPVNWMKIRLARTETLTRPDYIQYAPITSVNGFRSNIRANNGLLRPAQSENYDAAISVYQNKIGLLTFSGFRKRIDDLIISVNYTPHPDVQPIVGSITPLLAGTNIPEAWYATDRPVISTFINNPFEAKYNGFEIDWQTHLWYLPSALSGMVLNLNYTHINSETQYQGFYLVDSDSIRTFRPRTYYKILRTDSVRVGRMPNQPSHILNATIGYDLKGFSTRLSFLYQTDVSTFIHSTNPLFDSFSGDYFRIDLTLRQKLNRRVEFYANLNNLNNRPDENFRGATTATPSFIEYYGFTTDAGVRYRF